MFDVTIVTQSFLYRPSPHHRGRKGSVRVRTHVEEEEGLLSAGATGADEPVISQRRRAAGIVDADPGDVEG